MKKEQEKEGGNKKTAQGLGDGRANTRVQRRRKSTKSRGGSERLRKKGARGGGQDERQEQINWRVQQQLNMIQGL